MKFSSLDVVILPSTVITSNGSQAALNIPDGFIGCMICTQVSAASGTSPTLNIFVQDQFYPAGASDGLLAKGAGTAIFDDFYATTTISGIATKVARFTPTGMIATANTASITSSDYAISDASLANGSIRPGPVGNIWRIKWTVSGTSPSFTVNMSAKFIAWT